MPHYTITLSMAGYMPESDPYVFSTDEDLPAMPQLLEHVREECDRMADSDAMAHEEGSERMQAWDKLLDEIEADRERAADLDESGVLYRLPDGMLIEASRYSGPALVSLGYVPELPPCSPDSPLLGLVVPDIDDEPDFTPYPAELVRVVEAWNYREAYGDDGAFDRSQDPDSYRGPDGVLGNDFDAIDRGW